MVFLWRCNENISVFLTPRVINNLELWISMVTEIAHKYQLSCERPYIELSLLACSSASRKLTCFSGTNY